MFFLELLTNSTFHVFFFFVAFKYAKHVDMFYDDKMLFVVNVAVTVVKKECLK